MAIAKLGPIVQSIIGSISGVTFRQSGTMTLVTPRRRRTPNRSPAQIDAQRVMLHHIHVWDIAPESRRLEWVQFAKSQIWKNRLGVGRHPTARQCFMYYAGIIDPRGIYPYYAWSPVLGGYSLTPAIASLSFSAAGACNVIASNCPIVGCTESASIVYPLQYGQRRSAGVTHHLGAQARSSNTLNYRSALNAAGLTLTPGDRCELKIYWRQSNKAFGTPTIVQTIVTA